MTLKQIHARRIWTSIGCIENGIITIEDERITTITQSNKPCKNDITILPALIDTHIHGVMGADVMDATHDALNTMSRFLATHGIGAFLATTVTDTHQNIEKALVQVKNSIQQGVDGAMLLGSYLEGPFFSSLHKGAHPAQFLQAPDKALLQKWAKLAEGTLKCVALAPEYPNIESIITWLRINNIRVMLGHSNADYQTTKKALLLGANGVVHCYNGMTGLHHRQPGMVGAALTTEDCQTEIIVDGHHVHPAAVNIAFNCCQQNLILITDAMRATGMPDGDYYLGEKLVHKKDDIVTMDEGNLAGSTLTLDRAVKNLSDFTGISFEKSWLHGSYYPAKALGIDHDLGSIAPSKLANLVILDSTKKIIATLIAGKVVYQSEQFKPEFLATVI
ncbi:N-acetylglucosamine-6-phosphate deacetylase [Orbaceae bacterium ac157xtp]